MKGRGPDRLPSPRPKSRRPSPASDGAANHLNPDFKSDVATAGRKAGGRTERLIPVATAPFASGLMAAGGARQGLVVTGAWCFARVTEKTRRSAQPRRIPWVIACHAGSSASAFRFGRCRDGRAPARPYRPRAWDTAVSQPSRPRHLTACGRHPGIPTASPEVPILLQTLAKRRCHPDGSDSAEPRSVAIAGTDPGSRNPVPRPRRQKAQIRRPLWMLTNPGCYAAACQHRPCLRGSSRYAQIRRPSALLVRYRCSDST